MAEASDEEVILDRVREMARRLDDQESYDLIAIRLNHLVERRRADRD